MSPESSARSIELRPIQIKVDYVAERSVYKGTIRELILQPTGMWQWKMFFYEIPEGIAGFFKKSPDRASRAIREALLKGLYDQMTPFVRLRKKS